MIYLSQKNESNTEWNHLEPIFIDEEDKTESRNIEINITNKEFSLFHTMKGDSGIECDLKNCGSVQDNILKLHLNDSFDYSASYKFTIGLDDKFKSEMTLQVA
jgi:hypothetical protein